MSILKHLEDECVVSFHLDSDGNLCIGECCDNWYQIALSKPEAKQLLSELMEIVNQMP